MAHSTFPSDLPIPQDDGACNHLPDTALPNINLPSTGDLSHFVNLSQLQELTIIFCYPRTGGPNEVVPATWDAIPGARGCTPQACSFRDNLPALKEYGVKNVYGLSTQSTEYQKEVHERLHLPYELLSDEGLAFVEAMRLPTIGWEGKRLVKRITLAVEEGKVVKYWYPVFPPDRNVLDVLEWVKGR
ncbi:hypothetical protein MMC34_005734 [Xylographa carneopallida]|nr:hypothetical protein [Xylographa carneopallida]